MQVARSAATASAGERQAPELTGARRMTSWDFRRYALNISS